MKHTIFAGNRKKLHAPAFVSVCLRNWKYQSGIWPFHRVKKERDHFVFWSREERGEWERKAEVLYRINVYPK
jgi:hypothetical protein